MSTNPLASLVAGVTGRFWTLDVDPDPLKDADAVYGQLQLVDGVVRVKTQSPADADGLISAFSRLAEGAESTPRWLFGITELGPIVVPVVTGESSNQSLGGTRVSTRTYRSSAIAVGVDQPFGPRLTRLSVDLPFAEWADLNPMTQTGHFNDEHRWTGLDITLRGTETLDCGRVGSIALTLNGTWNQTEGEQEHLTSVSTGLQVTTESRTPREHTDHVEVAMAVQDLLSLAYDRFLPAQRSRVVLEGATSDRTTTWFYHRSLVEAADMDQQTPRGSQQKIPLFRLSDLGGPAAVSRWVALARKYPDAANAVRVRDRVPTNPTRRINELGAAIEQYVASVKGESRRGGRKGPLWTGAADTWEGALARRAGPEFAAFVGDPETWGRVFHRAYLGEKHHLPEGRRSSAELVPLSSSAQLLLIATLLNRSAGSRRPSRILLTDHRVAPLGEKVRQLIDGAPPPTQARRRRQRKRRDAEEDGSSEKTQP